MEKKINMKKQNAGRIEGHKKIHKTDKWKVKEVKKSYNYTLKKFRMWRNRAKELKQQNAFFERRYKNILKKNNELNKEIKKIKRRLDITLTKIYILSKEKKELIKLLKNNGIKIGRLYGNTKRDKGGENEPNK